MKSVCKNKFVYMFDFKYINVDALIVSHIVSLLNENRREINIFKSRIYFRIIDGLLIKPHQLFINFQ